MNARRVQSSINGLQRDITNYEAFLSKVIKGKVDKPKSAVYKPAQNVNTSVVRGASVTPLVSDPSVKVPHPPKVKSNPRKAKVKPTDIVNRVLCKEVFENSNATVEVTVKTRRPNVGISGRKRSRSNTLTSVPAVHRTMTKDETQKQSKLLFQRSDSCKYNKDFQHGLESHSHLNEGSLPWAHILKDKNTACMIHSANPKDEDEVIQKKLRGNRRSTRRTLNRQHKHLVPDDSISSSISDDSSHDQKSCKYVSRHVQCSLPEIVASDDKQKYMLPSKMSAKCNCNNVGDFSLFNPVRTLNFLVKELRGKLQKNEDRENLQRIIKDMENALMCIPLEINAQEVDHTSDIPTRDETTTSGPVRIGFVPVKPAGTSLSKPVVVPNVKFAGQGSFREFEHFFPTLHEHQTNHTNLQSSKLVEPAKEITPETQTEQRDLKVTNASMDLKCKQLELACGQLRKERDNLIVKILSVEKERQEMQNNEKDYLTTISCLRSNLENMKKKVEDQAKVVAELAESNAQLKEVNKTLLPLNDAETVQAKIPKESGEEEGRIQAQLQLMKLEHDKFEILMACKDKELEKIKQELRDIQVFASEQLMNLKSFSTSLKAAHQTDSRKQSLFNNKPKLDSLATEVSLCHGKPQIGEGGKTEKQPIFSSPTSSGPSYVNICPSWKNISRISASDADVNKLSSDEVFELSQTGKNNIKNGRHNSDVEGNGSLLVIKPGSPEFKSFLAASMSEDVTAESRHESGITEPKTCKELKDELRNMFEEIKKQTRMRTGVSLPSPPRHSEISEPGGISQWSEISDVESIHNSVCFSSSSAELNNGKFDFGTSDGSFNDKFEADN